MPDPDIGFLKIRRVCCGYIDKRLGVDVCEREPAALYLYHDTVSLFERMRYLIYIEGDFSRLAGYERFRFLIAVAEFATEDFCSDQPLITFRVLRCVDPCFTAGKYVDEFYD